MLFSFFVDFEALSISLFRMKPEKSVDSSDFRVKLLTQEIQFAKLLAGNEFNVATKEKNLKKLSTWLKNRSSCSESNIFFLPKII